MASNFKMSPKQKEVWKNTVLAHHRWNVIYGATRAGKTYLDYYKIMARIIGMKKKDGDILFLGNTKGSLERNIFTPMRRIWGDTLIGHVNNRNEIRLFGQLCYAIGADNKGQVSKIQGLGLKYCYGDEVATWAKEVFEMLKSRLDKEYSVFDGTCNPDEPDHWFHEFLQSKSDIYQMHYTIYDNPFLSDEYVKQLEIDYEGTVYFQRFILGLWARAEGVIYSKFSAKADDYLIKKEEILNNKQYAFQEILVGVDFGGTKSGHAFVATGILRGYSGIIALMSEKHKGDTDPDELGKLFTEFCENVYRIYGRIDAAYCDNAEPVLIRGLKNAAAKAGIPIAVRNAIKEQINSRIRTLIRLIARNRFKYTEDCQTVKKALQNAVWNSNVKVDERLDDGTTDIDTLDALEYTFERYMRHLIDYIDNRTN